MEGSLAEAIEAVTTMDIVEGFSIPYQMRHGKTYLLCPGHEDKHYGSCYIDKDDNGYYCYACGEHVNKWAMLIRVSGYTNRDAARWFFETSGLTPSRTISPLANINKLIQTLEPYVDNAAVYDDIYDCRKLQSSYGRNINGDYLYSELVYGNPLLELYKSDKELFKKIVINILDKRISALLNNAKISPLVQSVIQENEWTDAINKQIKQLKNLKDEVILI